MNHRDRMPSVESFYVVVGCVQSRAVVWSAFSDNPANGLN